MHILFTRAHVTFHRLAGLGINNFVLILVAFCIDCLLLSSLTSLGHIIIYYFDVLRVVYERTVHFIYKSLNRSCLVS